MGGNGDLYFATLTDEAGYELHLASGSNTPTLIDINEGPDSSEPQSFTEVKGKLYFVAFTEQAGYEPYRLSPGSTDPTLIDLVPGAAGSNPSGLTEFKGKLYLSAADESGQYGFHRFSPASNVLTPVDPIRPCWARFGGIGYTLRIQASGAARSTVARSATPATGRDRVGDQPARRILDTERRLTCSIYTLASIWFSEAYK